MNDEKRSEHLVAIPYPGRGHINPMMNLCKLLVTKYPNLAITVIVTEEWLSILKPTPIPHAMTFKSIPNVIPLAVNRASNFVDFFKAVFTKMEVPVEELLNELKEEMPPVLAILADTYLPWAVSMGHRRNTPLVSLWTQSPSVFSMFYHFDLVIKNGQFPANLSERGNEIVDYIPGIASTHLAALPAVFSGIGQQILCNALDAVSSSTKAQAIILTTFEELEPQVTTTLKEILSVPIYSVGPVIPHTTLDTTGNDNLEDYFRWLDLQPAESVLYISFGSFLSVSSEQMEEIIQGIRESGVRYLWVARGDTSQIQEDCGEMGLVVPWCDQLKVLCHPSIGGFWTHCGWNSTLEGVYAGVPMLTCAIAFDQAPNQKLIVEDWKIGMIVKKVAKDILVGRKDISKIVQRFMDLDGTESKEMRINARVIKERCRQALSKGGSSEVNLDAFVSDFCRGSLSLGMGVFSGGL
ncbi:7-deoxyloganetin glucosyltransferase [Ranunculus cassubicifolius]